MAGDFPLPYKTVKREFFMKTTERMRKIVSLKVSQIFAIVFLIISVFIYFLIYSGISKSKNDEVFDDASSQFSTAYGRLDTIFDVEQKFITAISQQQIFSDFLNRYGEPKHQYATSFDLEYHINDSVSIVKDEELRKELNSQLFLSQYTVDVAIARISDGHTITRTITTDIDSYLKRYGLKREDVDVAFSERETTFNLCELLPIKDNTGQILYVYKITSGRNRDAYVFMCLDVKKFINMHGDGVGVLAITKNGEIILSDKAVSASTRREMVELLSKYESKGNDPEKNMIYDTRTGQGVFVKNSETCIGYKYVYYISGDGNKGVAAVLHILVILLLVTISVFMSKLFDRYFFVPFGRLKALFETKEKDSLKLSYMINEVENVMLTNKNLKNLLDEHSNTIKSKFILDCAKGMTREVDIREFCIKYEYDCFEKESVCIIFTCQVQNVVDGLTNDEWMKIKKVLFETMSVKLDGIGELLNSELLEFLYVAQCKDTDKISRKLSTMLLDIENEYDIRINAAISNIFSGLENLHKAYSQAQYAKAAQLFSDGAYCIKYADIRSKKNKGVRYPINIEKNLIDSVLANKPDFAKKTLSGVLQENVLDSDLTDNDVGEFVFTITGTIKRIIEQINKTEQEIFGKDTVIYLELKMCSTRIELANKITGLFEIIFASLEKTSKTSGSRIADDIINYIDANYQVDLSLTDVCEQFSLSLSYVSRMLREYKNTTFKTYLMQKRVSVAKEIMQNNRYIKIADLAQKVGYLNTMTFIRVFKSQEGISPGAYLKGLSE